jgi:hypothetical protein
MKMINKLMKMKMKMNSIIEMMMSLITEMMMMNMVKILISNILRTMSRDMTKILINNIKGETVICNNNIRSKDKVTNFRYLKLLKVRVLGR